MKKGDFLIVRKSMNVVVWNFSTKEKLYTLELKKGQKYEIYQVLAFAPHYSVEVKYNEHIIGFSLIDVDGLNYDFYRNYFYNHRSGQNKLRKLKLEKLNESSL